LSPIEWFEAVSAVTLDRLQPTGAQPGGFLSFGFVL
jgi:hypothetical protein